MSLFFMSLNFIIISIFFIVMLLFVMPLLCLLFIMLISLFQMSPLYLRHTLTLSNLFLPNIPISLTHNLYLYSLFSILYHIHLYLYSLFTILSISISISIRLYYKGAKLTLINNMKYDALDFSSIFKHKGVEGM